MYDMCIIFSVVVASVSDAAGNRNFTNVLLERNEEHRHSLRMVQLLNWYYWNTSKSGNTDNFSVLSVRITQVLLNKIPWKSHV